MSLTTDYRQSFESQLRHGDLPPGISDRDVDGPDEPAPSDELDCDAMEKYIVDNAGDIASDLDTDDDAKLMKAAKRLRDSMREAGAK